jgi:hypothetical protein
LGITKNTNRLSLSIVQATESADNFSTVSKRLSETIGLAMPNLDAHRDAMDLLNATVNQAGISLKGLGRSGDAASNDLTRISATLSELVLQSELEARNAEITALRTQNAVLQSELDQTKFQLQFYQEPLTMVIIKCLKLVMLVIKN